LKADILEQLSKTPIITAAIRASGVARSTYYKWHNEDPDFAKLADTAIKEGRKFVNDIAISKLMQRINEGHLTAIIFWLKNNHLWFAERIRHDHEHRLIRDDDGAFPPEQREEVVRAIRLSGMAGAFIRHEEFREKFLKSAKQDETPDVVQSPAHVMSDEERISDWGTDKPREKMRKELERGGINIKEFLKRHPRKN